MPIPDAMKLRITHATIAWGLGPFSSSVARWHPAGGEARRWQTRPGECASLLIGKDDGLIIDGDCTNRVSAPEGGVIHICGDLRSTIDAAGHYDIIVTGNITSDGAIVGEDFCNVFVGGSCAGEIHAGGSAHIWIERDFTGTLTTGNPSTRVHIGGDYRGEVKPRGDGALLWITIAGFASQASLIAIADGHFTQFEASVGSSDIDPGVYPARRHRTKPDGGNSYNRWVVAARGEGN